MTLQHCGPAGHEHPGMLDEAGRIPSPGGAIDDTAGEAPSATLISTAYVLEDTSTSD